MEVENKNAVRLLSQHTNARNVNRHDHASRKKNKTNVRLADLFCGIKEKRINRANYHNGQRDHFVFKNILIAANVRWTFNGENNDFLVQRNILH